MKKGGIGGANTNASGLKFEHETDLASSINTNLSSEYVLKNHVFKDPKHVVINTISPAFDLIRKSDKELIGIIASKNQFYNVLEEVYSLGNINSKRWIPDEAFFNLSSKTVFIVEKKWQNVEGSIDEKLLSFGNKRRIYQNILNNYKEEPKPTVEFSALLNSDWFLSDKNKTKYGDCFNSLRNDGIKIFFDEYEYWWFGL